MYEPHRPNVRLNPGSLLFDTAVILSVGFAILSYRLPIVSNTLFAANATYIFGTATQGAELQHDFEVRNLHPWTITVTGLKGDCGCTRSFGNKNPPFTVPPLGILNVRTQLDTATKKGDIRQSVRILTADNPEKGTVLSLVGRVIPERKSL